MEIKFYGASAGVTGTCHILRVNGHTLLLDCGMIQGGKRLEAMNKQPFPFNAETVDAVILSHAHIDHSGRLPLLVRRGFKGKIWTQNASRDLCSVLLTDSARIMESDARYKNRKAKPGVAEIKPLYSSKDAQLALQQIQGIVYRQWQQVLPGVKVRFQDAGHILGSAVVELDLQEGELRRRLVFSGDLGQYDTPILRDPESPKRADFVLMETTYGGRRHRDRQATIDEIGEIISAAAETKGNILIPAFSVGRSQEILYQLASNYEAWGIDRFQVFLDSPMAIETSELYWNYPQLFDQEARLVKQQAGEMPLLPNLVLSRSSDESKAINKIKDGAIIIAASGMCTGGRILHHLRNNLSRAETQVIIVGYQAHGTLGRKLVDGVEEVRIYGQTIKPRAQIHTVGGLSAHGDQDDLARWYEGFENKPKVYLVHGEDEGKSEFQDYLKRRCEVTAGISKPGLVVDLAS